MNKKEIEQLSFEQAMEKMDQVVGQLESGDLPLEKSIELFQLGMVISHVCSEKLEKVENKIQTLIENKDGFELQDIKIDGN